MNFATAQKATPQLPTAPGPTGWPLIGVLPSLQRDQIGLLMRLRDEFGPIFSMPVGIHTTLVTTPEHVKHVLQDNHLNYVKGFDYQRMEPLLGHGLLTSNGEEWKRHRRLAQPGFHRQRLAGFGEIMVRLTRAMIARWERLGDGATVDLHAELMRLTLEIVGEALFSSSLGEVTAQVGEALGEALVMTTERMHSLAPMPMWLPTPFNRAYTKRLSVLDSVVRGIIAKRRTQPPSDDLLSMLMEARDQDDSALDDTALRDEVMTMILAGHETTANALSFAFMLLTQHHDVEQRMHDSVSSVLGDRVARADDAASLGYVRQVAEEAMRLYPPAWMMSKQALNDDVIGGYRIPAKSLVMTSPFMTQRDPTIWPDPMRFDPDRFAPEKVATRHRFAFFPFSAGPRQCIGLGFAMMELQLIVATLSQHMRVRVIEPEKVEVEAAITLRPRHGLPATVSRRRDD